MKDDEVLRQNFLANKQTNIEIEEHNKIEKALRQKEEELERERDIRTSGVIYGIDYCECLTCITPNAQHGLLRMRKDAFNIDDSECEKFYIRLTLFFAHK